MLAANARLHRQQLAAEAMAAADAENGAVAPAGKDCAVGAMLCHSFMQYRMSMQSVVSRDIHTAPAPANGLAAGACD